MMKVMTSGFLRMGPALAGLLLAVPTATLPSLAAKAAPDRPPNIIFMLADDLGYGDLSCYNPDAKGEAPNNTPIRTPVLDRLAKNGVRLTDFHSAAPLCSPSRRALLSARYASRLGEWAEAYRGSPDGMVASREPTIGMWLKQAGYATACYGKWHEYVIDVTKSPAWDQWTPRGRIGMVMPEPAKSAVTVEIDYISSWKTKENECQVTVRVKLPASTPSWV